MKIRMKTWQIAFAALLSALLPVCLISVMAQEQRYQTKQTLNAKLASQQACKGNHSRKDFYKSARMLPPVTIPEILGNRVNYVITHEGIELGSFDLEPGYSVVPKEFTAKNHSGCYSIIYCEKHLVILNLDQLDMKYCQLAKS